MWDNLVMVYLLVNFWCQLSSSWLETSVSNSKYIDPFTIHAINVFIYSIWWLAGQWLQPISSTRADFGGFRVPRSRSLILTQGDPSRRNPRNPAFLLLGQLDSELYLESRLRPRPLTKKTHNHPSKKQSGWKSAEKIGRKKNITFKAPSFFFLGYQKEYNSCSPGSPKTPTPPWLQRQIPRVLRLHIRGNGVAPVEEGSWDGNPDDLESCGARGGDKTSPVTPNMGRIVMDVMVYEKNPEISLCDSVCVFCRILRNWITRL